MIIAYDAKRLFLNSTGLGNYSRTLVGGIIRDFPECGIKLLTPRTGEPGSDFAPLAVLPSGKPGGSLWRTFGQARQVDALHADLYHGLSAELPVGLRVPAVVTVHDVAWRTWPRMYSPIDRFIYDRKLRCALAHAARVVAISESTKRDIIGFYGVPEDRISVVYQPVQPLYYEPLSRERARTIINEAGIDLPSDYILTVGSVNSRKNLLGLIKAIELLPRGSSLPLVIVGGGAGNYRREVEHYITDHRLQDCCLWRRVASNTALQAVYTLARVFAYPSFYEGFGLPVVEAMLQGCPVVTSSLSSLPEAAGPGGLLIDPYDPTDIAAALLKLLTNAELGNRLANAGRNYALSTFEPHALTTQMMEVYRSVAD